MDLLYGRQRTLSKFKVLELIARVPYQAGSRSPTSPSPTSTATAASPGGSTTGSQESRAQQDNEQWHLLILEELIARSGSREAAPGYYWSRS